MLYNYHKKQGSIVVFKNKFVFFALIALFFNAYCYKYDLAICALFQDEAPYLKEWIEFHKLVGVQHFYLYNNVSKDDYLSVLKPYIESGEVDVTDWPVYQQPAIYTHGINRARGEAKWLAVIDIDEFLFAVHEDSLPKFLKNYEEFGGIGVNWLVFGTSFIEKIPAGYPTIEKLRYRATTNEGVNKHVKSIFQPEHVTLCPSAHFMQYKPNYFQVTPSKKKFAGPWSPEVEVDLIRINHYWTRDEYYFENVKLLRKKQKGNEDAWRRINKTKLNSIKDEGSILRFIPALRKAMGLDC